MRRFLAPALLALTVSACGSDDVPIADRSTVEPIATVEATTTTNAPTTTVDVTTTTEPPPPTTTSIVPGGPDDPSGPILCPGLSHPAHHRPCPAPEAASAPSPARTSSTSARSAPAPAPVTSGGNTSGVDIHCESGGNYAANTGNGYYGAYQWLPSTFDAATRAAGNGEWAGTRPDQAPPAVQDAAAAAWVAAGNRNAWPSC